MVRTCRLLCLQHYNNTLDLALVSVSVLVRHENSWTSIIIWREYTLLIRKVLMKHRKTYISEFRLFLPLDNKVLVTMITVTMNTESYLLQDG